MFVERKHGRTQQAAVRIIDQFLDELLKREFKEIKIKNPEKQWLGNKMNFSFTVKKGFKWTTVSGSITVDAEKVALNGELGSIARRFVSDDEIMRAVNEQFDKLFVGE
jgi:ribosome-binding ATPase YchF (GTP1/OBG family)